jgi:hypothetical protein
MTSRAATPPSQLAAAALCLAALALQCVLSMRSLGATYDEHAHLPAGYTYLKTGEIQLNPQHPPLVKLLAALPLLFLSPRVDWNDESWAGPQRSQWRFGARFLYAWGNDADRLLFWGRLPIVALSLLLGVYVFRWSTERFGPRAGLFALALYSFCPNVIAHSRFVTMDLAVSCFLTMSLYHLWRYWSEPTRRQAVLCGVTLGLALATKFSALVVAPLVIVGLLAAPRMPAAAVAVSGKKKRKAARASAGGWPGLADAAIAGGLALLVVWVAYLFPADPAFYIRGVSMVNRDHNPDHQYYMLGQFKPGHWLSYFAVTFLLKTPVPVIVAAAWAAVLAWRSRQETGRDDLLIVVPAVVFFAFTSLFADNLGIRYVLPLFPLLFVFVSRLGEVLARRRSGLAALAVLAAWQITGALRVYPDYLAYFNEPSGGPAHGYRLLDDSNVDWGQDLPRLGQYLKEHGTGRVKLCFDLLGHPPYYGIDAERVPIEALAGPPTPGTYAIATHCLVRVRMLNEPGQPDLDWLTRYKPIDRVGYSFYIFKF